MPREEMHALLSFKTHPSPRTFNQYCYNFFFFFSAYRIVYFRARSLTAFIYSSMVLYAIQNLNLSGLYTKLFSTGVGKFN